MTRRTSNESLAAEAARHRHERNEARAALADANRMLLGVYLRGHLADPRDFEIYIGMSAVLDSRGAINWSLVDSLLAELLAARPHLAVRQGEPPWRRGTSAVDWFQQQTV